jgi:hypothetical protein
LVPEPPLEPIEIEDEARLCVKLAFAVAVADDEVVEP